MFRLGILLLIMSCLQASTVKVDDDKVKTNTPPSSNPNSFNAIDLRTEHTFFQYVTVEQLNEYMKGFSTATLVRGGCNTHTLASCIVQNEIIRKISNRLEFPHRECIEWIMVFHVTRIIENAALYASLLAECKTNIERYQRQIRLQGVSDQDTLLMLRCKLSLAELEHRYLLYESRDKWRLMTFSNYDEFVTTIHPILVQINYLIMQCAESMKSLLRHGSK